MRTTVARDPDTEALVREEMRRTGRSFKEILNTAIRHSLFDLQRAGGVVVEPLFTKPIPSEVESRTSGVVHGRRVWLRGNYRIAIAAIQKTTHR